MSLLDHLTVKSAPDGICLRGRSTDVAPREVHTVLKGLSGQLELPAKYAPLAGDLFLLRDRSGVFLYSPLRRAVVEINEPAGRVLRDTPAPTGFPPAIDRVLERLAALPAGNPRLGNAHRDGFRNLVLLLTRGCNLACPYCFASSDRSWTTISRSSALEGIGMVLSDAAYRHHSSVRITFLGGGEPTAVWPLLCDVTESSEELARGLGVTVSFSLVTNGTLISAERAAWIAKHIAHTSVSTDVLPSIQNTQRPLRGELPSFFRMSQGIQHLLQHGVRPGLRATVTASGIRQMSDMVAFVYREWAGCDRLQLEPVATSSESDSLELDPSLFVSEFMRARSFGKTLGIVVECSISRSLDRLRSRFCSGELCITPEARIVACHRISSERDRGFSSVQYGSLFGSGVELDVDKYESLRNINARTLPECQSCFCRWTCGGDCMALRWMKDGDLQRPQRCDLVRALTVAILRESLQEKHSLGREENGQHRLDAGIAN